jgi:hypothetical protein
MGKIIPFPRPDPERDQAQLIQEARALYESIFPTEKSCRCAAGPTRTGAIGAEQQCKWGDECYFAPRLSHQLIVL